MKNVLAIDPGVHQCACALFDGDGLLASVWLDAPRVSALNYAAEHVNAVLVERPQRDGRLWTRDPKHVIDLAWQGAKLAAAYAARFEAELIELTPTQWKGSEHKPQQHARLWRVLSDFERALLGADATCRTIREACVKGALDRWSRASVEYYPRAFSTHNILDATALGAKYSGRLR